MKCPTCRCMKFYFKDQDDKYEIYEFDTSDGKMVFNESLGQDQAPQVTPEIETYCNQCAWHGKFNTLNK